MWLILLSMDYFQKHPLYNIALSKFIYYDVFAAKLFCFFAIAIGIAKNDQIARIANSGLMLFTFSLLWLYLSLEVYANRILLPAGLDISAFTVTLRVMTYTLMSAVILLALFALGSLIIKRLQLEKFTKSANILFLITGFAVMMFIMFF